MPVRQVRQHPEVDEVRVRMRTWMTGRTVHSSLEPHLEPDERVVAMAAGRYADGRGLLALTDRRVVLTHDEPGERAVAAVPLDDVVAVEHERHGNVATVRVRTATSCRELRRVDLVDGAAVAAAISAAVATSRGSGDGDDG